MPAKLGRSTRLLITNLGFPTVLIESIAGVGPRGSRPLHVSSSITLSLDPVENRASIVVHNLAPATRQLISAVVRKKVALNLFERVQLAAAGASTADPILTDNNLGIAHVQLFSGYGPNPQLVFEGDSTSIIHHRPDNTTWETIVESSDAGARLRQATISQSWAPGTPVLATIIDTARAIGLQVLPDTIARLTAWLGPSVHVYGFTATGSARAVLDELLSLALVLSDAEIVQHLALGQESAVKWTVLQGALAVFGPFDVTLAPPVEVSPLTGLIGRPEETEGGGVVFSALVDARFQPGNAVVLQSRHIAGTFRVERATFETSTDADGPHHARVEASNLNPLAGVA